MAGLRWAWCGAALAGLALAGCGGGLPSVSGVVTLDGKPLANASVSFQPEGGGTQGSYAKTDEEGRYTLKVVGSDRAGAVAGKHVVRISQFEGSGSDSGGREKLPARYNAKTTLTFEVPAGGTDKADFALQSDKKPAR